ncbi:TRAP transporter permease [Oceanibaculum pacificum]|uniref:C4-dicarboxylate ABC transporter permease n=1 Tax=Oceanibaculum pacificum TaxID=580166 RepID=A0A154WFS5_9PROT|nr:TRAP transporter permease [Oceanibaculum pacificum]KZD12362.1 C4-dicarboxylate ABC transporter permease [Oceanibaculum pacificum]
MTDTTRQSDDLDIANNVADEPPPTNERRLFGWERHLLVWSCIGYAVFHLLVLNVFPMETWSFRIIHVAGGLAIGFALVAAWSTETLDGARGSWVTPLELVPLAVAGATGLYAAFCIVYAFVMRDLAGVDMPPPWVFNTATWPALISAVVAMLSAWYFKPRDHRIAWYDWLLMLSCLTVCGYLLFNVSFLQFRAGVMPTQPDYVFALIGVLLILELTRRVAGLALLIIAGVFILYTFAGPYLPTFLHHDGYRFQRFFSYIYTDNGILGPTVAVSSTYIILFVAFGAFLQVSKVGDYFNDLSMALFGWARGGPAKVAVFASGLMGMINGTSAGNVVATGSFTIPLMKKVGYRPRSAAAIEAAASTGGQIMPPIMGAGAFIMAEITGIPYTELIVAALIPAILYFLSIFFMVDFEAARMGMKGMKASELPKFSRLVKQVYLFIPVIILIAALFMGYSVIRAGTLALISALVVSWLSPNKMGPRGILKALEDTTKMSVQLIAVCACAGIIVGVIGLTGVGLRFSSMLLAIADTSQLLALFFAMGISILLGMGMPTTAAYAVAASVVAPGLIQLGITPLVAHMFVFYFAVISAITPPVALAAYAGAAIAGSDPMKTSVTAFKLGLAAFIVPFMFFYNQGLLMEGEWYLILRTAVTATIGVYLLSGAVQAWFYGPISIPVRVALLLAALLLIEGGIYTDVIGIALGGAIFAYQRFAAGRKATAKA